MNDLFLLCLSLSLSGTLIAAVLFLSRQLLRKLGTSWQYYLWLFVLLRWLIPFGPEESLVGGLMQWTKTQIEGSQELARTRSAGEEGGNDGMEQQAAVLVVGNGSTQDAGKSSLLSTLLQTHGWGLLWSVTALFLLCRKLIGYFIFVKTVKRDSRPVTDEKTDKALALVCQEMRVHRTITVCTNAFVRAPMLLGFVKPRIILPDRELKETELMCILWHELTHERRKDFLYKWLAEIAVCLHWFNPAAYFIRKEIARDCELSCDEAVVLGLGVKERQAYGETLLRSIVVTPFAKKEAPLYLTEDGKRIKERLCEIMNYEKKSKKVKFIAVLLTGVLLCGTFFAGAYPVYAADRTTQTQENGLIRIRDVELSKDGKISLGAKPVQTGTNCQVELSWKGEGRLTILCTKADGTEQSYPVENGAASNIRLEEAGTYTISVQNTNSFKVSEINGSIALKQTKLPDLLPQKAEQTITYESVELRHYEEGSPYLHDVQTNGTKKDVLEIERGMLAYDKDGNPLKLKWYPFDEEDEPAYFYLFADDMEMKAGETYDIRGGWSLDVMDEESGDQAEQVAYALYCNRKISFADGTVWENPEFEQWLSTYEGKKIPVEALQQYYPYVQTVALSDTPPNT